MEFRFNLVFGPGLMWVGFVLLMVALSLDQYVTIEYTRVDNTTFTNHYGVFTASMDGLTGATTTGARTVLVDCEYGIGGLLSDEKTTSGCEVNCKTMKSMTVLSSYFMLMALMYVYDAAEMAVVTDSKHRFVGGIQALFAFIFAATLMGSIQSQMATTWDLPTGTGATANGNYGVCAYKLQTKDALTLRDAKDPGFGNSLIIGWTAVGIMALGVVSHMVQVLRHRGDGSFAGM